MFSHNLFILISIRKILLRQYKDSDMMTDKHQELPENNEPGWEKNDLRSWPYLTYEDLIDYLIHSKAYDGKEMRAFRATYGYNYVQNGWLGDIYHIEKGNLIWMKATVSPSQPGTSKIDYNSWILVEKTDKQNSFIQTASCSCPAGLGRACSHVSAIAYAVSLAWLHGLAGHSCTDLPVAWGKGSASKTDFQEKLRDIKFSRPKKCSVPLFQEPVESSEQKEYRFKKIETHLELKTFVKESAISKLWHCKGTLLNKIINAPSVPQSENLICLPIHGNHDIDYNNTVMELECQCCDSFYNKYVRLSECKIKELTNETKNQDSSLWMDSRKVRIPASKLNAVPKTQRADPYKFVNNHLYTRFKGNSATEHGKLSEPKAKLDFESVHNCTVNTVGTVVHKHDSFLSASPDGIISNETLLEIKCPLKPISELTSDSKNYDIIKTEQGYELNKKGRNGYYYQVQMQMHCTNIRKCKFFVWNSDPREQVTVDVNYDEEFINQLLPRVRSFYFKHMLVRLVDDFQAGRFILCDEYKKFCT